MEIKFKGVCGCNEMRCNANERNIMKMSKNNIIHFDKLNCLAAVNITKRCKTLILT